MSQVSQVKRPNVKRKTSTSSTVPDKYMSDSLTVDEIKRLASDSIKTTFKIDVDPPAWPMRTRAKFPSWMDKTFKYDSIKDAKTTCSLDDGEPCTTSSVSLYPHQKFIKDYIQYSSPYRGMLVYFGLGVGKSCASIAAAEILANHMDVVVMVPAALRPNYLIEIKKCGRRFFNVKQHWTFVPLKTFKKNVSDICDILKIDEEVVRSNKGLWVPLANKPDNFSGLQDSFKLEIQQQIDNIIHNRFEFINIDGLRKNRIREMTKDKTNPFDNKCVVIDEVHNLISRVFNKRDIGSSIYKLLMKAQNCKLILLSGTPMINYPHEISYLINLITGFREIHELKAKNSSEFKPSSIGKVLEANSHVDNYNIDINTKKITIELLPKGFVYANKAKGLVKREQPVDEDVETQDIINDIIADLSKRNINMSKRITSKTATTLPEDQEEFNKFFVDFDKNQAKNTNMFMRRILGAVSYYNSFSPKLFPSSSIIEVPLEMTNQQFNVYDKRRADERKKESHSSKNKAQGNNNIFQSSGQVYRFYSRACCNFVFPEEIVRPFPGKLAGNKDEYDDGFEQTSYDEENTSKTLKSKSDMTKEYQTIISNALESLYNGKYLELDNLQEYSPKFTAILENIQKCPGTALIYSQFRKVEGIGILSLCLQKLGYAELKLRYNKKVASWDFDINKEDRHKPKFVTFTGNNEETQLLLKLFNSDLENIIDKKIRKHLHKISTDGILDNLHGSLIKIMMITQSGAEGISLKNVRQVHIVEPYWNQIRIDQAIGRAIRTNSHSNLPEGERHVDVYIYLMKFTSKQLKTSFTLRTNDKSMTTDQYIYTMAKTKAQIMSSFLNLLKQAAVDCALNAKAHGGVKCFGFPSNIKDSSLISQFSIENEQHDDQYATQLEKAEWTAEVLRTKKGNFIVKKDTNEVYDYDIYIDTGKLVKIGDLTFVNNKRVIVSK